MYKLDGRILKGGEGEPTAEELAAQAQQKMIDDLKTATDEGAVLKAELEALKTSSGELEKMLLDPSYTDYLAKQKEIDEKGEGDEVDKMTNAQLLAKIKADTQTMIQETVDNLSGNQALKQAEKDVADLRAKNEDFDLYKKEMIEVAKAHPTLSVKQVYRMAKSEVGPRSAPVLKGGTVPNNQRPGVPPTPKGVDAQLDAAWKASGIGKVLKEV